MRLFLLTVFCFSMAGCCEAGAMGKAKQDMVCKNKGGVYQYVSYTRQAECRDGSRVDGWRNAILTPDYYPETERREDGR